MNPPGALEDPPSASDEEVVTVKVERFKRRSSASQAASERKKREVRRERNEKTMANSIGGDFARGGQRLPVSADDWNGFSG
jgi:hypothetical protein